MCPSPRPIARLNRPRPTARAAGRPTACARRAPGPAAGLLLALLALLAWTSCGPAESPPPTWTRLLDQAPASLERRFDPLDGEALLAHAAPVVVRLDLAGSDAAPSLFEREALAAFGQRLPPAEPGPRYLDGAAGRRLAVRPGEGFCAVLPLTRPGDVLVELQADGDLSALHVVALPRAPSAAQLADPRWALNLIAGAGQRVQQAGPGLLHALVPTAKGTRALLVAGLASSGPLILGELRLRRPTPLAVALLGGARSPDGAGVIVDEVAREALLLPPGGSVRWRATIPARAPRLSLALARLGAALPLTIDWSVRSQTNSAGGRWSLGPGFDSWRRLTPGLGELAGQEVDVTLSVSVADGQGDSARATDDDRADEAASLALVVGTPTLLGSPRPGMAPDVIVVSLDTLRADRLDKGSPATPTLQRLADDAVRFTDATSTSSWTLPAHSSLFTGRWPPSHGATNQSRRLAVPDAQLLAPAFRDAGYQTVAITGGGFVAPSFGLAAGFEEYGFGDPCQPVPGPDGNGLARTPDSRQRLVELLEEPRRRPLFAFVHTYAAHSWAPLAAELESMGLSADAGTALRERALARDPRLASSDAQGSPAEEAALAAQLQRLYDASASAADDLVAELLDTLRHTGRLEQTVLVVLSDHGQEILERGLVGHGHSLHAELVRVPLLVRVPGVAPAVVDAPVSLVDVAPTLRELLGLPADPEAEGLSLVPLLQGGALPPRSRFGHVRAQDSGSHRIDRGSLTLLADEDAAGTLTPTALYDLSVDPAERADLLPSRPDGARAFVDELAEHLRRARGSRELDHQADVDAATRQRLLELGYTGDG